MAFELPPLPYAADALEPVISKEIIDFHYGKHHLTYVNNLNNLVKGTAFENSGLEEIIKKGEGGIFNNGAQVWNHTFYWEGLGPNAGGEPGGKLAEAINQAFGSFATFKEKFSQAAITQFGSGWAWLVATADKKLEIVQTGNAGNPMRDGKTPLLTCDVWEHAYYLKYQNRRADYVAAFFGIINWKVAETLFEKA